jgi:O-antigen/teichoic acid export membrane protein
MSEQEGDGEQEAGGAQRRRLSRGGLLARNTVLNIGGQLGVVLLALIAVPILIGDLGDARFGLLTIAWVVIGYAGFFDLGLGRALTALAADRIGTGREHEVPALFWTALLTMLIAATLGALALAGGATWLVEGVLNVPDDLQSEAATALIVLSVSLPFVICSQAPRAMLETEQRFDIVNAITVPSSAFSYFGPVVALQFWDSLPAVVAMVVASRIAGFCLMFFYALRSSPTLRESIEVNRATLKTLFRFGGWIVVSNLVAPLMSNIDRVFVGALLSVSAVTYYATPYEIVRRMWIPSFAIAGVLFPAFALTRVSDSARAAKLFGAGSRAILMTMFPIALLVVAFSHEGMDLWLGGDFAERSGLVMQLLAVGVFANSLAQVPFGFVQSGRPMVSALVEVAEVPFFIAALVLLTKAYGIEGTALAWAGRQTVDAIVLHYVSGRIEPAVRGESLRIGAAAVVAIAAFALVALVDGLALGIALVAVVLAVFVVLAWKRLIDPDERAVVLARIARLPIPLPRRLRGAD